MKLSRRKREALFAMFGGRCAYCGQPLNARWQADHVEPVLRRHTWKGGRAVPTGQSWRPENDREDNLMPACSPCNNHKHAATLEQWRKQLEALPGVCERNHSAFRHALRFGLVSTCPDPVVFHFERVRQQQPTPKRQPPVLTPHPDET